MQPFYSGYTSRALPELQSSVVYSTQTPCFAHHVQCLEFTRCASGPTVAAHELCTSDIDCLPTTPAGQDCPHLYKILYNAWLDIFYGVFVHCAYIAFLPSGTGAGAVRCTAEVSPFALLSMLLALALNTSPYAPTCLLALAINWSISVFFIS